MTKTKRQLRAEAVERLMAQLDKGNTSAHLLETVMGDVKGNGANWNAEIHALIDLLTDECGPCYSCAKLAELRAENSALRAANQSENFPETPVFGNNPQETPSCGKDVDRLDSREKLEADVCAKLNDMARFSWRVDGIFRQVQGWLDRQAAITERYILTHPDERDEQIAELQREVDRLTRENISLARDLGECMAERDGLRRENAKLSDDEFYLRCTLVDMNGEVVG